jgi:hypothetical protein
MSGEPSPIPTLATTSSTSASNVGRADNPASQLAPNAADVSFSSSNSSQEADTNNEQGEQKEDAPSPSAGPKIIARHAYPSEQRPSRASSPLPPVRSPPSPPSFFGRVANYIGKYFEPEPAIIEYSEREIRRQTRKVRVKALKGKSSNSTNAEKVVRVMALVTDGGTVRPIEITAKHKRVNEIKMDEGVEYVAEEVYRDQIRSALRRLE